MDSARDGMHTFVKSALPRSRKGVKLPRFDVETCKLVSSEIETMISKSYVEPGFVRTSLHYFAVPIGDNDIRVVFDGTSCGLNETSWSSFFSSPRPEMLQSYCRHLRHGCWMWTSLNFSTISSPTQ